MGDKLVFFLPDNLEELLWMAPVISSYLQDRLLGNPFFVPRPPEKVTFVCKWEELHPFLKACWHGAQVVTTLENKDKDEADLMFAFDLELAYNWTKAVEKHISVAASFQLGTLVLKRFPTVAMELGIEIPGLILVVARRNWMEGNQDWQWDWKGFTQLGIQHKIKMNVLDGTESWAQMKQEVSRASVVVGIRGSATLLGVSMGKVVMELSPDVAHRDWTAKWESIRWRMVYGKLEWATPEFVLDRTGRLVRDLSKSGELSWVAPRNSSMDNSKVLDKVVESVQTER